MKPVAILGSGPAALLAAHAVGLAGQPIALFSVGQKSAIAGAQFLHSAIPELTPSEPDAVITYEVRGTAEGYAAKVYGNRIPPFVSFSNVANGMQQDAWNLAGLYDQLWDQWKDSMNQQVVDPRWLAEHLDDFTMVVSAIPLPAICKHTPENLLEDGPIHQFDSALVQIAPMCLDNSIGANTIVYDGTDERSWSRSSMLFGHGGTEWGARAKPPIPSLIAVSKPIGSTCTCWPEVVKVGRYGAWRKGVLVNDAFNATVVALHKAGLLDLTQ